MQVRREIQLEADLEQVWAALTDPHELAGWMGGPVDLDVRPGGSGCFIDDDGTVRHARVGAVDPEHRLSLRWWPDDGAVSEVTFELCPTETGTRLVVTETPLEPTTAQACPTQASAAKAAYWEARLDTLWLRVSAAALVA
jgi:uncharacterized protein YndB with AHSA1/START domain